MKRAGIALVVCLAAGAGLLASVAEDLYAKAEALIASGQRDQAVALLQQAAEADPAHWPSLCRLGEIHLSAGRALEAELLLKQAVQVNPSHGPCLSRYAQALLVSGRTQEAEEPLKKAAELMPGDAGVLFNLGRLYETTERPDLAIETYLRHLAVSTDPKRNATARLKTARLLAKQLRPADAAEQYTIYLKENPERNELRGELALALTAASRYPEALAEYERYFAAVGEEADGLARAGSICLLTRDLSKAVDYLERSVKLKPDDIPTRISLATALAQSGKHERALEVLRTVAADAPDDDRAHFLIGQSLMKLGRTEEARAAFERHRVLHNRIMQERMGEEAPDRP